MSSSLECIVQEAGALVENPLWKNGRLLWTDITGGKISGWDSLDGVVTELYSGPPVGGFTEQQTGDLLLFRVDDIAILNSDEEVRSLIPFSDSGSIRFNDVIAAPDGSVFAGTIGRSDESGGLFHILNDGTIELLFRGTGCANGMGFSPDQTTFYWTDTTNQLIRAWDFDPATSALSNPRIIVSTTPELPDGLTIDAKGRLYSARWGSGRVAILDPTGMEMNSIPVPFTHTTSICFGGDGLTDLYLTAAADDWRNPNCNGAIYRLTGYGTGKAEFKSAILKPA